MSKIIAIKNSPNRHQHRRSPNKPPQEFVDNNFALDRKIKEACKGLNASPQWLLIELPRDEDKGLIADFILNWTNESRDGMSMSPNTKRTYISALVYLARHFNHQKSFKEMTKEDIVDGYLRSLKRDFSQDIEQKWVNTFNQRGSCCLAFFKWLTQPDLRREERQTPPQLKGWRAAKRKIKTHVKQQDHWTDDEHKVFLERCEDLRLACYHAIALETGGRPGELLDLKISDLQFKMSPSTGRQYAEFSIGGGIGGKMKKPRLVNISDSIPYFNTWVHVHPLRDSPYGAYLFPSREQKSKYRNVPLKEDSLRLLYARTLKEYFPKLLNRPDVPLKDKTILKSLIYDRKHYPYLRRHECSTKLVHKVPQYVFNRLMGHSDNSKMYQVYVQELGTESNRELLIAKGIISREETISPAQLEMQPKSCPICHEPNKHNADLCFKCNWVLSPKGMQEVREKDEAAVKEAEETKTKLAALEAQQQERFKEMQEEIASLRDLTLKKSFEVIEKEVEANPPPYIEGADKMTVQEVLAVLQKRGVTTW